MATDIKQSSRESASSVIERVCPWERVIPDCQRTFPNELHRAMTQCSEESEDSALLQYYLDPSDPLYILPPLQSHIDDKTGSETSIGKCKGLTAFLPFESHATFGHVYNAKGSGFVKCLANEDPAELDGLGVKQDITLMLIPAKPSYYWGPEEEQAPHGLRYVIYPTRRMRRKEFLEKVNAVICKDCTFMSSFEVGDMKLPPKGPPPLSVSMTIVWDALLGYSVKVDDPNISLMARNYAYLLSARNLPFDTLKAESELQRYVCLAMRGYKPNTFDTLDARIYCNCIFTQLAKWAPSFIPCYLPANDGDEEEGYSSNNDECEDPRRLLAYHFPQLSCEEIDDDSVNHALHQLPKEAVAQYVCKLQVNSVCLVLSVLEDSMPGDIPPFALNVQGSMKKADFGGFVIDEDVECVEDGKHFFVEWTDMSIHKSTDVLNAEIWVLGHDSSREMLDQVCARAPQCSKITFDKRGRKLCENKTWRPTRLCYIHEKLAF